MRRVLRPRALPNLSAAAEEQAAAQISAIPTLVTMLEDLQLHASLHGDDGEMFRCRDAVFVEDVVGQYGGGHVPVRLRAVCDKRQTVLRGT